MTYKVLIYRNGEFYKEIHLKSRPGDLHIYKWEDVEMGSYSFEIVTEEGEVLGVTYNHTAPFANMFDAYVEKSKKPKPRYYVTKATYILGFAKRVLSQKWLDKLLQKV